MPPSLSIVMGVYNTGLYLEETIQSILSQTHDDFELICADDGSTDNSLAILHSYAQRDKRINVIRFENNAGVSTALNAAVQKSTGTYIGVADSDDLYFPQKFKKQITFLENNPDYVAVGSSMITIQENGRLLGWEEMPHSDTAIRWRMLFNSPFLQPTIVTRGAILRGMNPLYKTALKSAVDYDLWPRLLRYGKGYNFKEPFLHRRVRRTSISHANMSEQMQNRDIICSGLLQETFGEHGLSLSEIDRLRKTFFNKPRFHDLPDVRPVEIPSQKDTDNYLRLLKKYCDRLPKQEATTFLHEERMLLGLPYLSEIKLDRLDFLSLIKE